jgi:hypothetical protein
MKIVNSLLSSLAVVSGLTLNFVVGASAKALRSTSSLGNEEGPLTSTSFLKDRKHAYAGATLYVDHVTTSGGWDNQAVFDAFADAYNGLHKDDCITILGGFVDDTTFLPSGDGKSQGGVVVGREEVNQGIPTYDAISWSTFEYGKSNAMFMPLPRSSCDLFLIMLRFFVSRLEEYDSSCFNPGKSVHP